MKTLKRNGEFKRVNDSSPTDNKDIQTMLNNGWNYCQKSEWKSTRPDKKEKVKKKNKIRE